jgi:phosphopantetheine adenylyltransferase
MTDNVGNLVLEQLRAMRTDIGRIFDEIRAIRSELASSRLHIRGVETLQDADHTDIASLKVRVDRIEKRLELVDEK